MSHARAALFNSSHRKAALGALFSGCAGLNWNLEAVSVKGSLSSKPLTWIVLSTNAAKLKMLGA